MTDYRPVACGTHDRLESLAVKRIPCAVTYQDPEGGTRSARGRIADVFARDGEEFLRMEQGEEIRLDRLLSVDPQDA